MNKKTPMVSIILPTYNWREERIRKAIESVLNQTYKDFELIIINDASTNNVEDIIKEYEKKDDRVVYIKNEKNLKLTKTLNKWIDIAKWKYIARQDDDDIWQDKEKLWKQIAFLDAHEDYWLIWTNCIIMDQDENEMYSFNRPRTDKEIRENMMVWNWIVHSTIVMRKTALEKAWWYYNPDWNYMEDYELWLRMWQVCKMYNITDSYIKYRVNRKSVTISHYRKQKWFNVKLMFKYMKYYPKKYFLKGLVYRVRELVIPEKWTKYILQKFRKFNVN